LPAAVANGTNRVAILAPNVVAVPAFRRPGKLPLRLALACTLPALAGSVLGARLAVDVDDALFRRILALVMLGVGVLTLVDPARRLRVAPRAVTPARTVALAASFLAVGFYGGFVQAGVGFIIIAALLVHGLDLVRINAVKVFVVGTFTIVALAVFVREGCVDWPLGLALATGNAAGGWLGTRLAITKGHDWIRRLLLVVVAVIAVRLFWW